MNCIPIVMTIYLTMWECIEHERQVNNFSLGMAVLHSGQIINYCIFIINFMIIIRLTKGASRKTIILLFPNRE